MIDPSRTVADLVLEQPSRARVFEELGVDYCCGGKQSLSAACDAHGLAVDHAVAALESVSRRPVGRARLGERAALRAVRPHRHRPPRPPARGAPAPRRPPREGRAGARRRAPELSELRDTFVALRSELEEHIATEETQLFPLVRSGGPYDAIRSPSSSTTTRRPARLSRSCAISRTATTSTARSATRTARRSTASASSSSTCTSTSTRRTTCCSPGRSPRHDRGRSGRPARAGRPRRLLLPRGALAWLAATIALVAAAPQLADAGIASPEVLLAVHLVGPRVSAACRHRGRAARPPHPAPQRRVPRARLGGAAAALRRPGARLRDRARPRPPHLDRSRRRDRRVRRRRLGDRHPRRPGAPRPDAAREPPRNPALDLQRGSGPRGRRGARRPRLRAACSASRTTAPSGST